MIIAIDGPSGTGKSTVAKGVAAKLGFAHFDTGATYRSLAWWIAEQGINPNDEKAVEGQLHSFHFEIKKSCYFVNGADVTEAIRTHEISSLASKIAVYPEVRKKMVQIQRAFGHKIDAVFEGRDMGTVVFPEAEVKIFLTAKPEVRAQRRYLELQGKIPFEQILKDIQERDHNDSTRAVSPLKKAEDAILVDTSDLTAAQVIDKIVRIVKPSMHFLYWLVYWSARIYCKLFYRLKIYGLEHFRPGAAILAANHASFLDPIVLSISCPEEVHFLAKDSLFKVPFLGRLIRMLNSHPVARDAGDASTFKLIISLLQKGQKVILFPEGQRTYDGELLPIERGLPFLTIKAHCRIQPVYIQGTFQIWPRGPRFPKLSGRIACVFGPPIEWAEFANLDRKTAEKQIIERTETALRLLKSQAMNDLRPR